MPFGFNLPGPFTWHAQDKSSKKLLKAQKRTGLLDTLEDLNARAKAKDEAKFHEDLITLRGVESATEALTELDRLRGVSSALADRYEADLKAEVKAHKAEAKQQEVADAKGQRAADKERRQAIRDAHEVVAAGEGSTESRYDRMLTFYLEIARRHTFFPDYTSDIGFTWNREDAKASDAAWKQAKRERKGQ